MSALRRRRRRRGTNDLVHVCVLIETTFVRADIRNTRCISPSTDTIIVIIVFRRLVEE